MIRALVFWICLGVFSAAFNLSPAGQWIERTMVMEWIYKLRGIRPAPRQVLIVSMDQRAADLPVRGSGTRLWSRHQYASLIDRLSEANAAGIIMDVIFEDAREEAADLALATSLARSNRVVIFQRLSRVNGRDLPVAPLSRFASVVRATAVFPLPKLSRVDGYWPFFPVHETADGPAKYRELPSLPVVALQLRLLTDMGFGQFEQLLHADLSEESSTLSSGKPNSGDISTLMAELRAKIMSNGESGELVHKLASEQIDNRSPTVTMLRSLVQVYGTRGLQPLNFYGPSRTIETINHMDILDVENNDIPSLVEKVSGKMVFVGHSSRAAVDQQDGFRTVYTQNGLDLSGVEIAATAYANLTDGSMLRSISPQLTMFIHVLLAVVAAYIALSTSILIAVIATVILASGYFYFSLMLFSHAHILLPIGVPLFFLLPVTLFSVLLVRYFGTSRQAGFYRHGIKQLLPSRVMSDIESGRLEQTDHVDLHGTCMMTDVVDYTYYTEEQGHQRMAALSREYFSLVMDEIYRSGGELFDVEGDGLTAFWDHSAINTENEQLAACAALQIARNVTDFNLKHPYTPFNTRIGLNSGNVEATYIGGKGNRRYCLVGDVANTCSRLEGLNKRLGTSVLASKAVVSKVDTLLVRPVGVFLLKGKCVPLEVVEIVNSIASASVAEQGLCTLFAKAMNHLSEEKFTEAENILVNILIENATDGPARFYLELLNGYTSEAVRLDKQGMVHLYEK